MCKQICISISFFLMFVSWVIAQSPAELADAQLKAYNNRDIEAFLDPYSDSVKVYNQKQLLFTGKQIMRAQYKSIFESRPALNCQLVNRIVLGNTVIDHEDVTFATDYKIYAVVMYKVGQNKIQEVHFLERIDKE